MGWAAPCCSSAIWKVNTMAMLERTGGSGCRLSRRSGWRHFCAQREGHTAPTPCEAGGQTARARACPERPPRPRGSDVTGSRKRRPRAFLAEHGGRAGRSRGACDRRPASPTASALRCPWVGRGWQLGHRARSRAARLRAFTAKGLVPCLGGPRALGESWPRQGHSRVTAGSPSWHMIPTAFRPVGTVPGRISAARRAHLSVPDHTPGLSPSQTCVVLRFLVMLTLRSFFLQDQLGSTPTPPDQACRPPTAPSAPPAISPDLLHRQLTVGPGDA